jgi:hypothetical protein
MNYQLTQKKMEGTKTQCEESLFISFKSSISTKPGTERSPYTNLWTGVSFKSLDTVLSYLDKADLLHFSQYMEDSGSKESLGCPVFKTILCRYMGFKETPLNSMYYSVTQRLRSRESAIY